MSYHSDLAELAHSLADLLTGPDTGPSAAADLERIAAYRDDVLTGLAALHQTMFPTAGHRGPLTVHDLAGNPVQALGTALAKHPRGPVSAVPPSERATWAPVSDHGRRWQRAARAALFADAETDRLPSTWKRDDNVAWGAVADLCACVEAFAAADEDLRRLAEQYPGTDLPPTAPGLRLAAAECGRVAQSGPVLPVPSFVAVPAGGVRVLPVTRPEDLAGAQERLATMFQTPLTPPLLAQVAVGQSRAHQAAAAVLRAYGPTPKAGDAAAALGERAAGFADIATACSRVRSLTAHVGVPAVQQTGEILRCLERLAGLQQPLPAGTEEALIAFARRGGLVVAALDESVRRAVHRGIYLVPDTRKRVAAPWTPAHLSDETPTLLRSSGRLRETEARVQQRLGARAVGPEAADAAEAVAKLRQALSSRPAARPARPGHDFAPVAPRPRPRATAR